MNDRGPNSRTPSPSQETPPRAPASLGAELPQSVAQDGLVQSTKRRRDATSENDPLPTRRTRLTRKNLALFDKMGEKEPKKKKSKKTVSSPPSTITTTKSISSTTSGFADQAYKNGILHPFHSAPPTNLAAIRKRHARSRATASPPPASDYQGFVKNVQGCPNEATMVVHMGRQVLKHYDGDNGYRQAFNQPFTAFPQDVGFNNGLSTPQPDFVEGLDKHEFEPFPVDTHIQGAVLYKDDPFSETLPHLAGEWKGPGKDMEQARIQSAYDGAALVHARNQALSYLGKPDPPGHAEVTTFTTDGTTLNLFAHYAAPSREDSTLKYHQYQYASACIKDSHQGYKDGRRGLRNAQDHAREQSRTLRDDLKKHWRQRSKEPPLPVTSKDEAVHDIVDPFPGGDSDAQPPASGSTKPTARDADGEAGYEVLDAPTYAPTPPRSTKHGGHQQRVKQAPASEWFFVDVEAPFQVSSTTLG